MNKSNKKNELPAKAGGKAGEKKKKPLSIRDKKVVKGLLEGKSTRRAMIEAGFTENTANVKSKEKLAQLAPTIQDLMEKHGLTDEYLVNILKQGTQATKVISANVIARDGEGMADANSMTKDFVDVEDYPTRHKYMETGLKLKGHLKDKDIVLNYPVLIIDNFSD